MHTSNHRFVRCACDPRRAAYLNGMCPVCYAMTGNGMQVRATDYYTPRRAAA